MLSAYYRWPIAAALAICMMVSGLTVWAITAHGSAPSLAACKEARAAASPEAIYGQLVMVGFTGQEALHVGVQEVLRDIEEGYAGGLVFYSRNIAGVGQISQLTRLLKSEKAIFPPLLAVDEEGGKVERLTPKNGFARQPGAAQVASRGPKAARNVYKQLVAEVARAGFNFNLGPVVDLNLRASNPIIGSLGRSYGADPETVVEFAEAFVEAHRSRGIATALKHFPGHGSSRGDSHTEVVDVTGDWREEELVPYRELIRDRMADAVMVAHLVNHKHWSTSNLPATLSGNAVNRLRGELGFDGVVISDDLQMEAVARDHPLAAAITQALAAGNDMVLVGNVLMQQQQAARFAVRTIAEAVEAGRLSQAKLEQSFCRVIKLKRDVLLREHDAD